MEIRRDAYLKKLIRRKKNGLIKVVTGVRRCGKFLIHSENSSSFRKIAVHALTTTGLLRSGYASS